ncbi:MAG: hypothetical protein EDX89_03025 [Acidobacteria bacterium]|nr:MAG: hypothetical protein EDX89_03025 [Acidobacteriota bacterium]
MTGFLAGSLVQAAVAALASSVFLRVFRVQAPEERVRFRLLALAVPLLVHPALLLLPFRASEDFLRDTALFWAMRWASSGTAGAAATLLVVFLAAAASLVLLLRDLKPPAARPARAPRGEAEERLAFRAEVTARGLALRPPRVLFLEDAAPHLCLRGLRSPSLIVSTGALERLSEEEMAGGLAHELAHLRGRDVALSLGLLTVRALLWFNPVVQVVGRRVVLDLEERADDRAASVTSRKAVAAALGRLPGDREILESPLARAGGLALAARRERLLRGGPAAPGPGSSLRLAAAAASMLLLSVLVV